VGYTTYFDGDFAVTPPLKPEHRDYLQAFSESRRMTRDEAKAAQHPDPVRTAAGLPVGRDGGYCIFQAPACDDRADVTAAANYNTQPTGQPGLWCDWEPSGDGTEIRWSGAEKFYNYAAWLEYLIAHFLKPWGYRLDGEATWQGEDPNDIGKIVVTDNEVTTKKGRIVYE
jgi:hypothetical protein